MAVPYNQAHEDSSGCRKEDVMDKNNGLVGCLAIVGGFVVVYALLSVFWGLAVGFGPLGFAALMAVVFGLGYTLGRGER
jgi:hypothetical protein